MFRNVVLVIIALLFVASARAAGPAGTASLERPAAVNGTQYAVIAPIYDGSAASGGSSSFIRMFNGGSAASTFTVVVVGSPSARTYGTASYIVPKNASQQKSFAEILTAAGAAALNGGDTSYGMYLQNPDPYAGYQHVAFNNGTTFFENASVCARLLNQALAAGSSSAVLLNVHTTKLAGWPSKLQIHNYLNAAASYRVEAVDADTGVAVGSSTTIDMAANESRSFTMASLQTTMGIAPTINHVNLFITDPARSSPNVVLGHQVTNSTLTADFNLTTACAVNPASTAAAAASTTFEGTLAGAAGQSGTVSIVVQASIAAASSTAASLAHTESSIEKPAAVAQVSGTYRLSGASSVALAGTYDSATGAVSVSGGGFAFTGTVSGGKLSGSYTAPNNGRGVFAALSTAQAAVSRYCGTWNDGQGTGTFNIQISNGVLSGVTYGGGGVTLNGQASGTAISGSSSEGVSFSGTAQNGSISGSFVPTTGGSGTFTGSTCAG